MLLKKTEIKRIKDISTLIKNYRNIMMEFSCKPDREEYPYPKLGTVLDEEKSVRWNREEVDRLRSEFENKVEELKTIKNEALGETEKQIKQLLMEEYKINKEEMEILWRNAYEEGHSAGISEVYSYFVDYVDMYLDLLEVRTK